MGRIHAARGFTRASDSGKLRIGNNKGPRFRAAPSRAGQAVKFLDNPDVRELITSLLRDQVYDRIRNQGARAVGAARSRTSRLSGHITTLRMIGRMIAPSAPDDVACLRPAFRKLRFQMIADSD